MVKVIGVRFRTAGKIYFFDPGKFQIVKGDNVIVETARGIEFGTVVGDAREVEDDKVVQPLKPVLRIANQRDKEQEAANKIKEKEAFQICLEKIRKHNLDMKLIDAEYTFDNNKVLFYFTADGRIDFRELVKDLAGVFKTRIELRQIGVRDETKTVGGIGICGRVLCCHSYLSDFIPVSIKMAKEQNLSLNPAKISGVCGRLMCCLKHEEETYEELNRRLPKVGDIVVTDDGLRGEVHSVNVLRQLVKVVVEDNDEKEIKEYEVSRIRSHRKHGKRDRQEGNGEEIAAMEGMPMDRLSKEELKELALLEKEEDEEIAEREDKAGRSGKNNRGGRKDRGGKPEKSNRNRSQETEGRPEKSELKAAELAGRTDSAQDGEKREKRKKNNRGDKNRNRGKEGGAPNAGGENRRSGSPAQGSGDGASGAASREEAKSNPAENRRPRNRYHNRRKPAEQKTNGETQ